MAELGRRFVTDLTDWTPTILDVGFGSGESLGWLAAAHPVDRILGIEVHDPGIAVAVDLLAAHKVANVRVIRADVFDLLHRIRPGSLAAVFVLHPDPWPKQRQAHRRLVQPDFVGRVAELLRPGGHLVIATDDDRYARQIRTVIGAQPRLRAIDPPSLPETRYEQRGRSAGRARQVVAAQLDNDA